MPFDWLSFLNQRNIAYSTSGAHVGRGNVLIHCPWCGGETEKDHMHVSTEGKGFYCWRRPQHAGRDPARLVAALLGVSFEQALSITGQHKTLPSGFLGAVMANFQQPADVQSIALKLPVEFKRIGAKTSSNLVVNYLKKRNFTDKQIASMTDDYSIRFCKEGAFSNRVIFPVYFRHHLVSWTGRAISRNETLRYKSLSHDYDKAHASGYNPAAGPIGNYLLWYDDLMKTNAETIVLTEGPFDCLKINYLGKRHGAVATCFFTNRPSKPQIDLLYRLLPRFRNRYLMLDQGTLGGMLRLQQDLITMQVRVIRLPNNIKDPGELEPRDLFDILANAPLHFAKR